MDMHIPFHVLEQTTEGFSNKQMIGRGGYGKVYKGVYNGEEIAVKLFHDVPALDNKQFENEFFNLLKIKHPNVVRLVGYCYETQHKPVEYDGILRFSQYIYRILCFEFLQGGSLDKYLNESRDHDWPTCYNIIKGTCEGLNFLHGGCGSQILHLDLKPANILLYKDMRAKVADFGLARFFSKTQTHVTNTITGTENYMPPEYMSKKQISPKNDVYSLGVIIIDILAGHTGYSEFREMDDVKPFIELSLPTPTKSGPRGGTGGSICDIEEKPCRLTSITIFYSVIIDALSFSYIDKSGKKKHGGPWGTDYSNQNSKTIRFGPLEFVEEVSVTYGSYRGIVRVISLTFVTNVKTYGPFANPYQTYRRDPVVRTHFWFMADEGTSIVGFHGRSGSYIDAIGVYIYPSNRTTVGTLSVPPILDSQTLPTPTKSGPWGGSTGSAYDINEKPWRLTRLTVSYKGLIDAFSFSYIDQAGKKQSVGPWGGGYHSDITKTIRIGPSVFVKEVSGAYGTHHGEIIVKFLKFLTNVRSYGPFGTPDHPGPNVSATYFRFEADEGCSIVGFYGRSGRYINAIGVYTARVAEL